MLLQTRLWWKVCKYYLTNFKQIIVIDSEKIIKVEKSAEMFDSPGCLRGSFFVCGIHRPDKAEFDPGNADRKNIRTARLD